MLRSPLESGRRGDDQGGHQKIPEPPDFAGRVVLDPGFGFGKTAEHNIELLANLRQLQSVGRPILVGLSRKSTLGELTGRDVGERLPASIAAAVIAVMGGASFVRVHDVRETVDALRVAAAVMQLDGDS